MIVGGPWLYMAEASGTEVQAIRRMAWVPYSHSLVGGGVARFSRLHVGRYDDGGAEMVMSSSAASHAPNESMINGVGYSGIT